MTHHTHPSLPPRHVVIIGGGIAGMGAARRLASSGIDVTLIEASDTLGGACRAVPVELPDGRVVSVDVGVSDFNRATFTELDALMWDLDVSVEPVCQDASFRAPDGRWLWSSTGSGVACAPGVDGRFVAEIERFRRLAITAAHPTESADDWLARHGFSASFRTMWVAPRALGAFPAPPGDAPLDVSMKELAGFWGMHGIVGTAVADRVCVSGGMHRYVPAMHRDLVRRGVRLRLGERVTGIRRGTSGVRVLTDRQTLDADHVVLATAPELSLRLLDDPCDEERSVLGACRTRPARVVLHRDARLMPAGPHRWAAYNYVVAGDASVHGPTITFFPEVLAGLEGPLPPLFVTIDPHLEPRQVVRDLTLRHPILGRHPSMRGRLESLQGRRNTWFCGAWTRSPYLHEHGLRSGIDVAGRIHQAGLRVVRPTSRV